MPISLIGLRPMPEAPLTTTLSPFFTLNRLFFRTLKDIIRFINSSMELPLWMMPTAPLTAGFETVADACSQRMKSILEFRSLPEPQDMATPGDVIGRTLSHLET